MWHDLKFVCECDPPVASRTNFAKTVKGTVVLPWSWTNNIPTHRVTPDNNALLIRSIVFDWQNVLVSSIVFDCRTQSKSNDWVRLGSITERYKFASFSTCSHIFDSNLPRPPAPPPAPKLDLQYANNNAFCYIFYCFFEFSVVIVTGRTNFMINKVVKDKAVLPKAQNMVSSRRCLAEDSWEMYQDIYSACKAIVLLLNFLFFDKMSLTKYADIFFLKSGWDISKFVRNYDPGISRPLQSNNMKWPMPGF